MAALLWCRVPLETWRTAAYWLPVDDIAESVGSTGTVAGGRATAVDANTVQLAVHVAVGTHALRVAASGVGVAHHAGRAGALVGTAGRAAGGRGVAGVGVAQVHSLALDLSRWIGSETWRTLTVIPVVLGDADGVVAAGVVADVEAGVLEPVAGLVCGAVGVGDAADGGAAVDGVVGIPGEQSRRTLALRRVIVGDADGSRAAASGVANGDALPYVAPRLAPVGLLALGVRLALITGHWTAPTTGVRVASEACVTLALSAVVAGEAGGVERAVEASTDVHTLEDTELVGAAGGRDGTVPVILAVGNSGLWGHKTLVTNHSKYKQ